MSGSEGQNSSTGLMVGMIGAPWALFVIAAKFGVEGAAVGLFFITVVALGIHSFRPVRRAEIAMPSRIQLKAGDPLPLVVASGEPADDVQTVAVETRYVRPAPLAEALGIAAPGGSEADQHLAEAIRVAAADLPESERVALIGYYLEARSVQELSALLDCNESQVVDHIDTALDALQATADYAPEPSA